MDEALGILFTAIDDLVNGSRPPAGEMGKLIQSAASMSGDEDNLEEFLSWFDS